MQDEKIIALYWQRDQSAIDETDKKYGVQLRGLSYGILSDREDAEECVSDTYMAVWNSLPPQRPKRLRAYAAAIVRNLSLRRVRDRYSKKRGGGEVALALEELEDCLCSQASVEREYEQKELAGKIEEFLRTLSAVAAPAFCTAFSALPAAVWRFWASVRASSWACICCTASLASSACFGVAAYLPPPIRPRTHASY